MRSYLTRLLTAEGWTVVADGGVESNAGLTPASATLPVDAPCADGRGPRITVLIVSASMGAGHQTVSAELSRRLELEGVVAPVVDLLELAGPAGARLRRTYRILLDHAPWLYGGAMALWARWPRPLELLTAAGSRPFEAALARVIGNVQPNIVVSTYNLASQCLGRMAVRGRLRQPIATVVIDPGPHPYWVSRSVALHLVGTSATAARLVRYGARNVTVASTLLRPEFDRPPSRAEARRRLGLPPTARIALFTAGSWGVGGLERSLSALTGSDNELIVLVLCGRNEQLRKRVGSREQVRAVGWVGDMAGLLCAADVVVDNAGGLTCWEAMACGTPVVLFRPLPGHGVINARTLHGLGWARYARSTNELRAAVREAGAEMHKVHRPIGANPVAEILQLAARRISADNEHP